MALRGEGFRGGQTVAVPSRPNRAGRRALAPGDAGLERPRDGSLTAAHDAMSEVATNTSRVMKPAATPRPMPSQARPGFVARPRSTRMMATAPDATART